MIILTVITFFSILWAYSVQGKKREIEVTIDDLQAKIDVINEGLKKIEEDRLAADKLVIKNYIEDFILCMN